MATKSYGRSKPATEWLGNLTGLDRDEALRCFAADEAVFVARCVAEKRLTASIRVAKQFYVTPGTGYRGTELAGGGRITATPSGLFVVRPGRRGVLGWAGLCTLLRAAAQPAR